MFLKGDSRVQYRAGNKAAGSCEMSVGRNIQTQMIAAVFLVIRVTKWPAGRHKGQSPGTSRLLGCDIASKTNINHRKLTSSGSSLRLHI